MEPIKEIGEIRYCFPAILLESEKCSEKVHIPEVFDKLITKMDEMIRRLNELSEKIVI